MRLQAAQSYLAPTPECVNFTCRDGYFYPLQVIIAGLPEMEKFFRLFGINMCHTRKNYVNIALNNLEQFRSLPVGQLLKSSLRRERAEKVDFYPCY
jgi:hypothetical protein